MVTNKRRAIIIYHPAFDTPGPAGVQAAQQFATGIVEGQRTIIQKSGTAAGPEAQAQLDAFRFYVRSLPEDIFK
jgi:hypothetical protein